MNANKQSNENKSDKTVISDEQKIRLTVKKSLEAFYAAEEKKHCHIMSSYGHS